MTKNKEFTNDREGREKQVRLDKWLYAARFYKTRTLAHEAIEGGKVYVDGVRAKPSRVVLPGQILEITSPRGRYEVRVEAVSSQRLSAALATELYRETEEGKKRREELLEMQRLANVSKSQEKPTSHDRKILRRLKEDWS